MCVFIVGLFAVFYILFVGTLQGIFATSNKIDEPGAALVLTLESTQVSACSCQSLVSKGRFKGTVSSITFICMFPYSICLNIQLCAKHVKMTETYYLCSPFHYFLTPECYFMTEMVRGGQVVWRRTCDREVVGLPAPTCFYIICFCHLIYSIAYIMLLLYHFSLHPT